MNNDGDLYLGNAKSGYGLSDTTKNRASSGVSSLA